MIPAAIILSGILAAALAIWHILAHRRPPHASPPPDGNRHWLAEHPGWYSYDDHDVDK